MHHPFKRIADNARDTAKQWDGFKEDATVTARTCEQCGAPRPVNTNIARCSHCGLTFMDTDIIIHHRHNQDNDAETGADKPLG